MRTLAEDTSTVLKCERDVVWEHKWAAYEVKNSVLRISWSKILCMKFSEIYITKAYVVPTIYYKMLIDIHKICPL